ncbi:MAG: ABC transporter ATP-binding protein [Chloroflexi bacterium]|nr:ABC transporter ATP-binding protein [Chloroflexota bacterium]
MGWRRVILAGDDAKTKKVTWALIRRVLTYGRPYALRIVFLLITILATTTLGLLTPQIIRDLFDNAIPNADGGRLNVLALALIAIPVVGGGIRVVQRRLNATIGEGVIYDLRVALYAHMQKMSLRFFTNTKSGELTTRLNDDVIDAQRAVSNTIVDIITNLFTVVATLGVLLAMEWRLTILGVGVLPLFYLVARRVGSRLRALAREQMGYNAQMNVMMNETLNISGALLVKLFGRVDTEVHRFEDRAKRVRDSGVERAVVGTSMFVVIGLISAAGTALVYWLGGHLVLTSVFTIGTLIAFGQYLTQLYGPLQALTNAPVDFATSMVSFERVFEVLDLPVEIDEAPDAVALTDVRGALTFDHVTFNYAVDPSTLLATVERDWDEDVYTAFGDKAVTASPAGNGSQAREQALDDISFDIVPGQLVALVGPSGAGKTTMTYLVPRLYDPTEGRVLLDGYDLRDLKLESLSAAIGMVTQETYLFHDSIRTNLKYARPDATDVELVAAAKAANIHDFISGLPQGYDTVVGERGYRLSGGEKQRLALARVILKDPRILVLDEATSSLDSQSEALIQEALKTVMQGRTSIVIAHRLSTILSADQIFVMDRGRVVERGTHSELLALGGLYANLYETQFRAQRQAMGLA